MILRGDHTQGRKYGSKGLWEIYTGDGPVSGDEDGQMNTCGTCRFFGESCGDEHTREEINNPEYHICNFVKMGERFTKWTGPAVACDASDYHAVLCVKEDFGCNQWKAALDMPSPTITDNNP